MSKDYSRHTFYCLWNLWLTFEYICTNFLFKKYFVFFKLSCTNNTKGFHCDNSIHVQECTLNKFTSSIVFSFTPSSFPLFQTLFGGFHYAVFICVYAVYFNPLHPSVSFPFPFPVLTDPLRQYPIYIHMLFLCHHHHHHFRSRFHRWVRTCDIWPFELGLPCSAR
jgi:hypothetical protein